eukprot:1100191_1
MCIIGTNGCFMLSAVIRQTDPTFDSKHDFFDCVSCVASAIESIEVTAARRSYTNNYSQSKHVKAREVLDYAKTVVFDMYGDQYDSREERLLLTLFQMVLK